MSGLPATLPEVTAALAPWLIVGAVLVYGVVHSWLASLGVKALVHQRTGNWVVRGYRLVYNFLAVLTFLPVLALLAWLPDRPLYRVPFPWALLMLAIQGIALIALGVGVLQTGVGSFLGVRQLLEPPSAQPPQLVVSGLYRWVRHPLYTAGLVFLWFTPLMTLNLLALYAALSVYLVVGAMFEERKLLHEFGEAYARYRDNTPMLVPRRKPFGQHGT